MKLSVSTTLILKVVLHVARIIGIGKRIIARKGLWLMINYLLSVNIIPKKIVDHITIKYIKRAVLTAFFYGKKALQLVKGLKPNHEKNLSYCSGNSIVCSASS